MSRLARWPRISHIDTAVQLKAKPGVWHRIGVYRSTTSAKSVAWGIRTAMGRQGQSYQPTGAFDAHTKQYGDHTAVIARYVGEAGR